MLRRLVVATRRVYVVARMCSTTTMEGHLPGDADAQRKTRFGEPDTEPSDPKQQLLGAALAYVPSHGWSDVAISNGMA